MITRFYVDNYKCLQNFEYKPKQFELILGANGTGKSTVFEALNKIQQFVLGKKKASELFSLETRTRWDSRSEQKFELDLEHSSGQVKYTLLLEYVNDKVRVKKEDLYIQDSTWMKTEIKDNEILQNIHFDHYREATQMLSGETKIFPISNPDYSAMTTNIGIFMFVVMSNLKILRIQTESMSSYVDNGQTEIEPSFSNFASYYSHLLQENQGDAFNLTSNLREVISDFDQFSLPVSDRLVRRLFAVMSKPNKNTRYALDELSDGQRALIALYTLLYCVLKKNVMLVIDEPENYIALRELQPWLMSLEEKIEEEGGQVILISHHPEFINMLAPERAILFERIDSGPVRIRDFSMNGVEAITPAELVARGWESDGE